jgi:hypothetical protein
MHEAAANLGVSLALVGKSLLVLRFQLMQIPITFG